MRFSLSLFLGLALWLAVSGCGSTPPVVGGCSFTYECEAGAICRDGLCVSTADLLDAGATVDAGAGPDAGRPTDGGSSSPDAGATADGGSADAGQADAGARLTFAPGAYRRCRDDLECAVFGGNCVIELTLSRPADGGVDRVRVSEIDPAFAAGEGVCTLPCTTDPRICDSLTVTAPTGASVPFTCQVVYAASSPYPSPAPAFPFDTQLDAVAMARGVPFASVCRPPFQHALTRSETFCQPCTEDMQCGTGACFFERAAATPRSGSCVEACSATSPCPFGFSCATLPGATGGPTYCVPTAGTCGRCRDGDGDLRGVGRCGPITQPNTAVDCDDANPVAYFDAANPGHAFPAVCGMSDVNCNGRSDDVEQLGTAAHCSACGDVCVGRAGDIPNARKACLPRSSTSSFACVADCEPGYADCDGDVSNGCEQQLGANSIYAEDADGDGRGSPTNFRYVCSGAVPAGWVQNRLDCDDTSAAIYGGNATLAAAPELCDGRDNNCNGIPDDPGFIVNEGTACDTGVPGVCAAGLRRCSSTPATADAGASGALSCVGTLSPATQATVAEACDGLDNDCDGRTDEDLDYYEANGQQNPNGSGAPVSCVADGGVGRCGFGAFACTTVTTPLIDGGTRVSGTWSCRANLPEPTDPIDDLALDSNCDGSDGDLSSAIFVRPVAGGGTLDGKDTNDGTAQRPVATVQRALALACAAGAPCKDIYLEATEFASTSPIALPTFSTTTAVPPVRIYGGFTARVVCSPVTCDLAWTRGNDATTLVRNSGPRGSGAYPFGQAYAGLQAASGSGLLSVLLDQVRVVVEAPDPSEILTNGQSAPTQVGFACPPRGCGTVQFRNVALEVAGGLNGGDGTAAGAAPVGDLNGRPGCAPNDNCTDIPFVGGEWMQYSASDYWGAIAVMASDRLPGRAVAGCPDGQQNNGGSSGAIRFQPAGGGNRGYIFDGQWGEGSGAGSGGRCWDTRDASANPQQPYLAARRGANGAAGAGARWAGSYTFRFVPSGDFWLPSTGLSLVNATIGRTGSGGGGGGGCIDHPNYFSCPAGQYRGGGGGAGGCGGFAAGSGGNGGGAIGLLLTSSATVDMTLTTSGAFRVVAGRGGNGGRGARGGASSAGGYGGLSPNNHGYLNGGHGGDGGGGGGGAGGLGGNSLGLVRQCTRSGATGDCGIKVPPAVLAAPGQYITVGAAGVAGTAGLGGAGTAKSYDPNRSDPVTPNTGGNGAAGVDGQSAVLFSSN
jgi:hypothetical protein